MYILVLNAGSSSFKSNLYQMAGDQWPTEPALPLWTGHIAWQAGHPSRLKAKTRDGRSIAASREEGDRAQDIQTLLSWLWSGEAQVIDAIDAITIVGHRIVHGGANLHQPTLIDTDIKAEIDHLSIFAPLHNPINLIGINVIESLSNKLPQIAVFDTAFYGSLPQEAYVYPGPYERLGYGIRKYGFHGISHHYCSQRAATLLGRNLEDLRVISCHLGNGCSLASIKFGQCIDTTMGFTPLDGLMMGTRCGSIDPGILLHLLREKIYTVEELDRVLNLESGLLGISGVSNDLREVDRAIAAGNPRAKLAFTLYTDRLTAKIASLLPNLGGIDALIFTAGVGENHQGIRTAVTSKLGFIGIEIDPTENQKSIESDRDIATPSSQVRLFVIHTQEEWQIAQSCWLYMNSKYESH